VRQGVPLSEALSGDGATIFRHACGMDFERRTRAWLKTKNPILSGGDKFV
jgi:hypothetical protein